MDTRGASIGRKASNSIFLAAERGGKMVSVDTSVSSGNQIDQQTLRMIVHKRKTIICVSIAMTLLLARNILMD